MKISTIHKEVFFTTKKDFFPPPQMQILNQNILVAVCQLKLEQFLVN